MNPPGTRTAMPPVRRSNSTANLWVTTGLSPGDRRGARQSGAQLGRNGMRLAMRSALGERPQTPPAAALRALESCRTALGMQVGPAARITRGHRIDMDHLLGLSRPRE